MAVADGLAKLSKRAKKAEEDAEAASTQARADLEKTINDVQASAEAEAKKVKQRAQAASDQVSDTWKDVEDVERARGEDARPTSISRRRCSTRRTL